MKSPRPNRNKALIRANVRRGAKSMRVPLVAQKHGNALQEPMICERCGAVLFERRGGAGDVSITTPSMPPAGVPALHANK
jgi:hypothetical protein